MSDKIRYAELGRFLEGLGFVCRRVHHKKKPPVPGPRTYDVWEHPESGALIPLPAYDKDEFVWPPNISATYAVVVNYGLLSRDDFDRWRLGLTRPATENGAARPKRAKKAAARRTRSP